MTNKTDDRKRIPYASCTVKKRLGRNFPTNKKLYLYVVLNHQQTVNNF